MKDVITEENFDFFNRDVNLLCIFILLEGFYRGQNVFTLNQFLKGDYWSIDEIKEEVLDTNDFSSAQDLVLQQVLFILEELELGRIRRMSVSNVSSLLEKVVREAVLLKDGSDEDVLYYTGAINEICGLSKLRDTQRMEAIKKEKKYDFATSQRVDFESEREASKHINYIASIASPFIEFEISFNDQNAHDVHEATNDYLSSFSQDNYVEKKPTYREKRHYFSKQIECFYEYVSRLPFIDNSVNIPFTALKENDFEIVKILGYLETEKRAKVRNWNDTELWNVKFSTSPLSIERLVGKQVAKHKEDSFKGNLSFDDAKSILLVGNEAVKIRKASDQFHLMRIMFEEKSELPKEWFYSDIAERYDPADKIDDKKFYNAAYQVNQKIIRYTGLKDVLITTTQSVRINPKYLS